MLLLISLRNCVNLCWSNLTERSLELLKVDLFFIDLIVFLKRQKIKGVLSTVKSTLRESLVQLLSPKRRVDILRDVMEARAQKRPFSIVFCGVNGVGKSTNLAKVNECENHPPQDYLHYFLFVN